MQLIHFLAAWLFPGAQCFAVQMATADSSDLDRASSSPSPSPSPSPSLSSGANAAGSVSSSLSSPSSTSSSSSSSDDGHRGFFKSRSREESPSTTPLCFGTGNTGGAMAPKVKGDVVGKYLRKISRRLKKARRSDGKGSPPSMAAAAAVDDTARERAEAVARAISYCKDMLRRGTSPPPSPSLDDWLHDRQEEIIATAAAEQHCDECSDDPRPSPTRPRRAAGGWPWPLGMQTMARRFEESPCPASPCRDGSLAAIAVAHVEEGEDESPHHGGHGCRGESTSSLDEMDFLKTFDGDEEKISRHFITVEL